MWIPGVFATCAGITFVLYGLVRSFDWEDQLALWAIARGGVLLTIGGGLFVAELATQGLMIGRILAPASAPTLVVVEALLAALLVVRFGSERELNPMDGPFEMRPAPYRPERDAARRRPPHRHRSPQER